MILGIIPARGGSKGIPRKNVKMIAGKPLIAWSIEAAKMSKMIDRFVVSTDDLEIAAIAREYGAEVVDRPAELATDEATTISALQHVLSVIDADTVVLLQPTSPVRDEGLIDRCIERFQASQADNLATGFICKLKEYGTYYQRRQDMEGFFYDDGNVYVVKADIIKKGTLFGKKVERIEITREQNSEIDDNFDFWMNEQILLKRHAE
ncbi:MAG: acylneuraminate cytidylyltransferase family protein [Candidatus Omnitrophica bacterium]|nr:acylneuraminate cytidylyltransferase family protein [Candidatus Omnitrophota bacterium]